MHHQLICAHLPDTGGSKHAERSRKWARILCRPHEATLGENKTVSSVTKALRLVKLTS